MRAYSVVGGAGQDNLPVLNPATTLLVNEAAGVFDSQLLVWFTMCAVQPLQLVLRSVCGPADR
jgi:hypothetical protein